METVGLDVQKKALKRFFKEAPIIVYKPDLSKIFGSVLSGLLASNLIYWSERVDYKEFYKTDQELCRELGCALDAFKAAKKKLLETKAFMVEYKGLPRKTYYSVNLSELLDLIKCHRGASDSEFFSTLSECNNELLESGKSTPQRVENPLTIRTSTTTSITTSKIVDPNKQHTDPLVGIRAAPPCDFFESIPPLYEQDDFQLNDKMDIDSSPTNSEAREDVKTSTPPQRPKSHTKTSPERKSKGNEGIVEEVFNHWKEIMNHPNARMDSTRRKLIDGALKLGYDSDQIKMAIFGCSRTPFNMGENDRGQVYDGLHIILKGADSIDRFNKNAFNPPRALTKGERLTRGNIEAGRRCKEKLEQALRNRMAKESEFKNAGSEPDEHRD